MRIISKPVVCATDNSASRSIQSHGVLVGPYIVHKSNGFELGNVIPDQRVSMLEIFNSVLRLPIVKGVPVMQYDSTTTFIYGATSVFTLKFIISNRYQVNMWT